MKKKIFIILMSFLLLQGCGYQQTEDSSIIYGDIDLSAEEIEITKPKNLEPSANIQGNTYLNLLQGGLFCENEDYYFFVINYNNENILLRENKKTEEKEEIFSGNIRNLFIINDWIYGIENNITNENMVVMDLNGNNIYRSNSFKREIRTMISDGEKIYFTVDASNLINNEFNSGIYSCNMDFSDLKTEKITSNSFSQVDLITKQDSQIVFNETYLAEDTDNFVYTKISKFNYPLIINNNIYSISNEDLSELIENNLSIITMNMNDNNLYVSIQIDNDFYLLVINKDDYELIPQTEKIQGIYVLSNDIVLYNGITFRRLS